MITIKDLHNHCTMHAKNITTKKIIYKNKLITTMTGFNTDYKKW